MNIASYRGAQFMSALNTLFSFQLCREMNEFWLEKIPWKSRGYGGKSKYKHLTFPSMPTGFKVVPQRSLGIH